MSSHRAQGPASDVWDRWREGAVGDPLEQEPEDLADADVGGARADEHRGGGEHLARTEHAEHAQREEHQAPQHPAARRRRRGRQTAEEVDRVRHGIGGLEQRPASRGDQHAEAEEEPAAEAERPEIMVERPVRGSAGELVIHQPRRGQTRERHDQEQHQTRDHEGRAGADEGAPTVVGQPDGEDEKQWPDDEKRAGYRAKPLALPSEVHHQLGGAVVPQGRDHGRDLLRDLRRDFGAYGLQQAPEEDLDVGKRDHHAPCPLRQRRLVRLAGGGARHRAERAGAHEIRWRWRR